MPIIPPFGLLSTTVKKQKAFLSFLSPDPDRAMSHIPRAEGRRVRRVREWRCGHCQSRVLGVEERRRPEEREIIVQVAVFRQDSFRSIFFYRSHCTVVISVDIVGTTALPSPVSKSFCLRRHVPAT